MQNQLPSDKTYGGSGVVPHDTGRVMEPLSLARKTGSGPAATPSMTNPDTDAGITPSEPAFLTIAEVARLLHVSERTVRRRIQDGTLRKVLTQGRLVRISVEDLKRLPSI